MSERHEPSRWSPATRIAFRFLFSYYTLPFLLPYLIFHSDLLREKYNDFWDAVVVLADETVVHVPYELFDARIGSDPYTWVKFLCTLVFAGMAAAVWSVLDRNRLQYERLHPWLRFAIRYMLAIAMIRYGTLKVIPSQMIAPPPLTTLQHPIGEFFPNHLLWWTVGASPAFETASGLVELVGGALLLLPRTTLLGALLSAANMLFVFLLNMCYDVPVKLYSFQLFIMAVVLVAPDLRRLADVFLFHRRAEPSRVPPLFRRKWLDRIPHVLLFVFGLYSIRSGLELAAERYKRMNPPRSPLYGVWSVEGFARDGKDVPLYTEPDRWRLVTFRTPGSLWVEEMAGASKTYELGLDMEKKTMKLGPSATTFSFRQPEKDVLILDGRLEGRRVRAKLRKMPLIRRTT
ncbi:MAG: hypothetical protein QOH06_5364 [Acidobacteriota bacterium]|jgi:uncharacterized membrane protein YphA (DoxX/SURF4 family)|nr:hypothetical protein [Acidobacteriota bacterium]